MFSSHMNNLTEVKCAVGSIPANVANLKNYNVSGRCYNLAVDRKCKLACKDGYRVNTAKIWLASCVISESRTTASWNFDDAPTCEEVKCDQIHIPDQKKYRTEKCSERSVGTNCPLTCRDGYRTDSSKTASARCVISNSGTTASWNFNDAPTCEAIKCEPLALLDGQKVLDGTCSSKQQLINSKCRVGCKETFRFQDAKLRDVSEVTVNCQLDTNIPAASLTPKVSSCEAIQCDLKWKPGTKNYIPGRCVKSPVGSQCNLTCTSGYMINSASNTWVASCTLSRNSRSSAEWNLSEAPMCEPITCKRLELSGGQKIFEGACSKMRQSIGSECRVGCKKKFRFSDDNFRNRTDITVNCQLDTNNLAASWNQTVSSCEAVQCEQKNMPYHKNYTRGQCPESPVGSQCQLTCSSGYRIKSTSNSWFASCNLVGKSSSSAEWNFFRAPACKPITCEPLKLLGGQKVFDGTCSTVQQSIDSKCSVGCMKNFRFSNENIRDGSEVTVNCRLNTDAFVASWNRTVPSCEAVTCDRKFWPPFKNYMSGRCPGSPVGTRCQLYCKRGYLINSTANMWVASCSSTSSSAAEWNFDNAPACKPISCKPFNAESYVVGTSCNVSIYGLCPVSCQRQFRFARPWANKDNIQAICSVSSDNVSAVWKSDHPQKGKRLSTPLCEGTTPMEIIAQLLGVC